MSELQLFDVVYPGYIIVSRPYKSEEDAKKYIADKKIPNNYSTYYCSENQSWYIIERQETS